jgi:hypothetical protein
MPKKKLSTYEQYILVDIFELFDGKNLEKVIKNLKRLLKEQPSEPVNFKVVKSEFGIGTVVYLKVNVPDEIASSEDSADTKLKIIEKQRKALLEVDKKEWENLRSKHSK